MSENHNLVADFYDQLAPYYSLIFPDWRKSISFQADVLDRLIKQYIPQPSSLNTSIASHPLLLDCACGIGTQAIGLALRGYNVHATDISTQAVQRAMTEAKRAKAQITFGIADFRHLENLGSQLFDVVLCCDNALPHLLTKEEIMAAAMSMKSKLKAGGLLLMSIRDYDKLLPERPRTEMPRVLDCPEGRRIVFQVWDWEANSPIYTLSHFILREENGEWKTIYGSTRYRALLRQELDVVLHELGFEHVEWHMPQESGYYQPIVTALG